MAVSAFDMFKIGIGPSSSHTVGPMRAAATFVDGLRQQGLLARTTRVRSELFGSLGATGHGHGSNTAVLLGLQGELPETVDTRTATTRAQQVVEQAELPLGGPQGTTITFQADHDLVLHRTRRLPFHPNGMTFVAWAGDEVVSQRTFYSIGGGFVLEDDGSGNPVLCHDSRPVPYPFSSGAQLLDHCRDQRFSIAEVQLANEVALGRSEDEVRLGLGHIWDVMQACITSGCTTSGVLPGGLRVRRRAHRLHKDLTAKGPASASTDPLAGLDWLALWALAVNEENAAGGRVVTAPTNGAAGIIPSVLKYATTFLPGDADEQVVDFLLTAAAIGAIYQQSASISGAEVGCQGEVGVACSMAAAGLCQVMAGTPQQVSNAAEIGLEHHLGLTCDPVGGLVQIPCIERNAVGSIQAVTAARLALQGDGNQIVSLDQVMKTMMMTGRDMSTKYKETARGGLAVNIVEC